MVVTVGILVGEMELVAMSTCCDLKPWSRIGVTPIVPKIKNPNEESIFIAWLCKAINDPEPGKSLHLAFTCFMVDAIVRTGRWPRHLSTRSCPRCSQIFSSMSFELLKFGLRVLSEIRETKL